MRIARPYAIGAFSLVFKMQVQYTMEQLFATAKTFATKKDFRETETNQYKALSRLRLLSQACEHMREMTPRFYVKGQDPIETAIGIARKYDTRSKFLAKHKGVYRFLVKNNRVDEAFAHMETLKRPAGYWTKERCKEAALLCKTGKEFAEGYGAAYRTACANGWLQECTQHIHAKPNPRQFLTKDFCAEKAALFSTRTAFFRGELSAYLTASRAGWLDEICQHMQLDKRASDADCIYLWEAEGFSFNGEKVYKIGITSARLGPDRISEVAGAAGTTAKIKFNRWVGSHNARRLEKKFKAMGAWPGYSGFNGCKEFRALSPSQVAEITQLVEADTIL